MRALFRVAFVGLLGVVGFAVGACSGSVKRPDGGKGMLAVGDAAPDFEARDAAGQATRLSQLRGRTAVVYFYPKDETAGCTKEACAFRDAWKRYETAGVAVLGVSRDSDESHRKFIAHHQLPFPLAADTSADIQRAYGVPNSVFGLASRVTFLVGPDGRIAKVWPDVDPGVHAEEVLAAAASLSPR